MGVIGSIAGTFGHSLPLVAACHSILSSHAVYAFGTQMAILVNMRSHKAFAEEQAHSQQSHGGGQQREDDEKEREKL